ncbi:SAP domain-containing protein [Rhizomonospora bruguierae]|uniref:SAP domain-containing protein n=1 Tax=Rhizomonospora bruguierae TaxID=1581705 RepID=UPI001BCC37F3|nr:SAP domain-containing protein [Micromonospora sp. NBRC 107566]
MRLQRLRGKSGSVVNVDDVTAERLLAEGWEPAPKPTAEAAAVDGYAGMKVAELRAEIERRNEGRDEEERIPAEGKKADLVAALEADDADNE